MQPRPSWRETVLHIGSYMAWDSISPKGLARRRMSSDQEWCSTTNQSGQSTVKASTWRTCCSSPQLAMNCSRLLCRMARVKLRTPCDQNVSDELNGLTSAAPVGAAAIIERRG